MYGDAAIVFPSKITAVVYCCLQKCISWRDVSGIQRYSSCFHVSQAVILTAGKCWKNSGFSNYRSRKSYISIQGVHNTQAHMQSIRDICVTMSVAQEPALRRRTCQSFLLLIQTSVSTDLCQSMSLCTACLTHSGFLVFVFFLFFFLEPFLYWFESVETNEISGGITTCVYTRS